jgi:hypothetical protein
MINSGWRHGFIASHDLDPHIPCHAMVENEGVDVLHKDNNETRLLDSNKPCYGKQIAHDCVVEYVVEAW